MLVNIWSSTAGEICDFIEKEIAEGRNPTTPQEWNALMERAAVEGAAKKMAQEGVN